MVMAISVLGSMEHFPDLSEIVCIICHFCRQHLLSGELDCKFYSCEVVGNRSLGKFLNKALVRSEWDFNEYRLWNQSLSVF